MKINKRNAFHWLSLLVFSFHCLIALVLRLCSKKREPIIILYGHKLSGNLKALYDAREKTKGRMVFLTMDYAYYRQLKKQGIDTILALNPVSINVLFRAAIIVSDHGLHSASLLLKDTSLITIDVWHGVPFKGFTAEDFALQHAYTEVWVTSDSLKKLYHEKFGFAAEQLKAIGYTRTDVLVNACKNNEKTLQSLGINQKYEAIILYAPTWQQDDKNRTIYPFGLSETGFYQRLDDIAQQTKSVFIIRAHLNYSADEPEHYKHLVFANAKIFPDTESILCISDILICDWSSIAFDFLLLERPCLFLDTPPPFAKGLSLGTEHRYGEVVNNIEQLENSLVHYIQSPGDFKQRYADKIRFTRDVVYNGNADGKATDRGIERINSYLEKL